MNLNQVAHCSLHVISARCVARDLHTKKKMVMIMMVLLLLTMVKKMMMLIMMMMMMTMMTKATRQLLAYTLRITEEAVRVVRGQLALEVTVCHKRTLEAGEGQGHLGGSLIGACACYPGHHRNRKG